VKKVIIIFIILVVIVIVFVIFKEDPKKQAIDALIDKWEGVAKKHSSSGVIDRPAVKTELDKLTPEDVTELNTFTDKIIEAKSALDYVALAGDALTARDILKKTNISNVIQGLFPEVFKK
jgi:hypothetical protein